MASFRYGVSLYSYTDDFGTVMTLDDAFEHVADTGSTGVEILGETTVPLYPEPPAAWMDHWFAQLDRYKLEPTNFACWVDTRIQIGRNMSVEEGAAQIEQDLRLAHKLGFRFIRPKFGVIDHELTPDPIWEGAVERNLDLAAQLDLVILPEIHSPTPIRHPVTEAYVNFIERTGTKNFGLMIDTGIFQDRPIHKWGGGETEEIKKGALSFLNGIKVPVEHLEDVIQYVPFIQAKFHDIDENLHDHQIPWERIVPMLKKLGYSGYLSSEYEGARDPWVAIEQVRRQHALIRMLEDEYDAANAETAHA
ncbi:MULTISPECIES: sugar phosphate isomerase/epimerase family protein [Novosphingobium]|uniref:sugar phosphate isomerase/epimerase family protein n=1 Tax=Novosphingobium TaxID=165696 RepID=UPI0005E8E17A|nr:MULTISPECIES: TIM barrel protein [Novosphingobium]CDO37953.1 Xylose isomerase-like TIM barrel [Novosphingobium sp. KN65.2]